MKLKCLLYSKKLKIKIKIAKYYSFIFLNFVSQLPLSYLKKKKFFKNVKTFFRN